jgi:hypothetical protein
MEAITQLPADRTWLAFLNTPLRAYQDLLLGASYLFFPVAGCFGAEDTWLTRHPGLVFLPWLAAHVWVLWKGRPLTRFLVAWVYLYLVPLALGGVPQARYYYMPTVPAAALVAIALASAWDALARRLPARVPAVLVTVLLAGVILQEGVFIRARLAEWRLSAELVQAAVRTLQRDLDPGVQEVLWVNLPRAVPGPSFPAFTFSNAAEYLPLMVRPPRFDVVSRPVYDRTFVEGRWPTIGAYATPYQIREQLAEPGRIGYEFVGRPPWIARLR